VTGRHREIRDDRRPYNVRAIRPVFLKQVKPSLWSVLLLHRLGAESPQPHPSLAHFAIQERVVAFLFRRGGRGHWRGGKSSRDARPRE